MNTKLKRDIILFGSIKQKHLPGMCMFRHTVRDFVESAFNSRMWVTKDGQVQSLFHPVFVVIYSYLTFYSIEYLDILTKFCYINKCHFEKFEMWQILLFKQGNSISVLKKNEAAFWKKNKTETEFYKTCISKKIIIE